MNELISCFQCFYCIFGKCPVDGSRNSATCLRIQKNYNDMSRKELEEATEAEYKKALRDAARLWHIRMDYIDTICETRGEIKEDEEPEPIH